MATNAELEFWKRKFHQQTLMMDVNRSGTLSRSDFEAMVEEFHTLYHIHHLLLCVCVCGVCVCVCVCACVSCMSVTHTERERERDQIRMAEWLGTVTLVWEVCGSIPS